MFLTLWSRDWPCRSFHLHGECEAGDNCKFSHDELTDETRPLLDVVRFFLLDNTSFVDQLLCVEFAKATAAGFDGKDRGREPLEVSSIELLQT